MTTHKEAILADRLSWPASATAQEDGSVLVLFRDIRSAMTEGATRAEALENASDALAEAIAATMNAREDIPPPSKRRAGEFMVAPDAVIAFKAMVYTAMRGSGLTNVDMAARLDVDEKEIRRMLDPAHTGTRVSRYVTALAVCDIEIEVGARSTAPRRSVRAEPAGTVPNSRRDGRPQTG